MTYFSRHGGVVLHHELRHGHDEKPPVVFLNSLGTDFRIWNGVVDRLGNVPCLLMDKRGHGLSDDGPTSIDLLAKDAIALIDAMGWKSVVICGVSVGGMIAQAVTRDRPDLVSALALCNTGTKIGTPDFWNERIKLVQDGGMDSIGDAVINRWFSNAYRSSEESELAGYRNMLTRTSADGYCATCAAIRDTDLTETTRQIELPTLCIGGSDDLATSPDLVTELSVQIEGSQCHILPSVGHLPCIEAPDIVAEKIRALRDTLL